MNNNSINGTNINLEFLNRLKELEKKVEQYKSEFDKYSSHIEFIDLGVFDHKTLGMDDVAKFIFNDIENLKVKTLYICFFTLVFNYIAIVQRYTDTDYGYATIFGYGKQIPYYYQKIHGTVYRSTVQNDRVEIN